MSTNILYFMIETAPRTKKNHNQIFINKKTGNRFITPSKAYKEYQEKCGWLLTGVKNLNINVPVNVKALYYMDTKRKVDLPNLNGALHDILVHYNVLEDDNSKIIVSTDGSRVLYDKENPRTEVEITEV